MTFINKKFRQRFIWYIPLVVVFLLVVSHLQQVVSPAAASTGPGGICYGIGQDERILEEARVLIRYGLVKSVVGNKIYFYDKPKATSQMCLKEFHAFFPFWFRIVDENDPPPSLRWEYAVWYSSYIGKPYYYAKHQSGGSTFINRNDGKGWIRLNN